MSRDDSYINILRATARMQYHIATILEAKADEAEKSRNWICRHVSASSFSNDEDQLKQPIQFHEQIVEAIDGITKVESGLAANLKVLLNQEDDTDLNSSGFGDLFNLGDDNGQ